MFVQMHAMGNETVPAGFNSILEHEIRRSAKKMACRSFVLLELQSIVFRVAEELIVSILQISPRLSKKPFLLTAIGVDSFKNGSSDTSAGWGRGVANPNFVSIESEL